MKEVEKWKWEQVTNEEFDKLRKNNTYYRIYHKDVDGAEIIDYKFWGKGEEDAYNVLQEYIKDHQMEASEHKFWYSKSGYYCSSSGDHYDTMEQMQEAWKTKHEEYDSDSREYDKQKIQEFMEDSADGQYENEIGVLRERINNILNEIKEFESLNLIIKVKIETTNLDEASEKEIDDIISKIMDAKDRGYKLKNLGVILSTGHSLEEQWNTTYHILQDLKVNSTRLEESSNGYPVLMLKLAADELGIEIDDSYYAKDKNDNDRLSEKAANIWRGKLRNLKERIIGYLYYSEFGIFEDEDIEMKEYASKHSIPLIQGTENDINYQQVYRLAQNEWEAIWNWMKEYGEMLVD